MTIFASDCFGYFCGMDGNFTDFVILSDYIALPQCIGFKSLGDLWVSYGVTKFVVNQSFGVVLCFRLFWIFLSKGCMIYGFYDLWGFHSTITVHDFLVSFSFRGFLSDD